MQILPATAYYLAHLSGGSRFTATDLATPRVNVAYGSYYLRYLLDHYRGNEMLAVAAYNGGLANVDRWVAEARGEGQAADGRRDPVPRDARIRAARAERAARLPREYPRELGLRSRGAPAPLATVDGRCRDFKLDSVFTPTADQPQAIESTRRGHRARRALPDAARRDRHRQDDDDGRA